MYIEDYSTRGGEFRWANDDERELQYRIKKQVHCTECFLDRGLYRNAEASARYG